MKRYIGLDVHAASTTFAVMSEAGNRLGSHVETHGQALVEQLKTIPSDAQSGLSNASALGESGTSPRSHCGPAGGAWPDTADAASFSSGSTSSPSPSAVSIAPWRRR